MFQRFTSDIPYFINYWFSEEKLKTESQINGTMCCVISFLILWSIFNSKLVLLKCEKESVNVYDFRVPPIDGLEKMISQELNSFWFLLVLGLKSGNAKRKMFVHPHKSRILNKSAGTLISPVTKFPTGTSLHLIYCISWTIAFLKKNWRPKAKLMVSCAA